VPSPAVALFGRRAREAARRFPALPADAPLHQAIAAVTAADASGLVVVDAERRPVGILTERDIARRAAATAAPDWPVGRLMTSPVAVAPADDFLYRVIAEMRRRDIRHLPLVEPDGRLAGVVDLDHAMAVAGEEALRRIEALGDDDSPDGLARRKAAEAALAADLLVENVPAVEVQRLLVDINLDIHRRIVEAAQAALGDPPVGFTALAMGSAGRGESLLRPDQDNGLIIADYPDAAHGTIDPYFIALAERLTERLAAAGFPLCNGNVMATNPVWRKTLTQWRDQVSLWCQRRSPVAVLFADIFFDFRPFFGDPAPADALRRHLLERLAAYPAFLSAIAENQANHAVAIGLFGQFHTVHGDPQRVGHVDLKLGGLMPLVGSVRLLALRAGIAATGTADRMAGLVEHGLLDADEAAGLSAAFVQITDLLLRQQIADVAAKRTPGNDILPKRLKRRDRDALAVSLRAVAALHRRVLADFTGKLW
jgi:signal-transduction protein with cAMP-binding, CBS, and nucleotidyltransferase domain